MSRHGRCELPLFIALLVFAGAAWGQGSAPMVVDFALWTKADSVTYFDTISITALG
jgi:hypothetical protein